MDYIWEAANVMRGEIESDRYKDYILPLIFYKVINDRYDKYISAFSRDTRCVDFLGYYIEESAGIRTLSEKAEEGSLTYMDVKDAFGRIIATTKGRKSEQAFEGLLGLPLISDNIMRKLIVLLKDYSPNGNDAIGSSYIQLVSLFTTGEARKNGEFYTPDCIAELVSCIVQSYMKGRVIESLSDPSCGSGQMLLTVSHDCNVKRIHGRDIKESAYLMAKMNSILHGMDYEQTVFERGNTLTDTGKEIYQVQVTNPPFSMRWDPFESEKYPVEAPARYADLAFVQNVIYHTGEFAVIILPLGVLYRRGKERDIRKWMLGLNIIDTIIKLPSGLFYGTQIPTCCMVLRKGKKDKKILFIDASEEFVNARKQKYMSMVHIRKVIAAYESREDILEFAKLMETGDIKDANLNISLRSPSAEACPYTLTELNQAIAQIQADIAGMEIKIGKELAECGCLN